ncbi:MAG TPA: patatin-like phospholipase family protein [Burkholderiales bacterium]|nr:patatin-like phospholipase family protein [Burkholderiales bacterium]
MLKQLALAGLIAAVTGCGFLPRNAVPPELVGQAAIPSLPDVRAWAGRPSAAMERDLAASFDQESSDDFPKAADGVVHYAHLALSGGGPNGAFGAGFLNGWTATGKRPVFKIVTGVSTGALMAPFAFIGPSYDAALREFYTTTATRNIFRLLSLIPQLVAGESLADSGPLASLIEQHVDAALLAQVAGAHARGRRLYVGTVDLDAQRFVVWNMGLIATSGRPETLALFRKVMLASASVPIAFPPVFFDVEAGGRPYDEMHVDGAVAARAFYSGGVFSPALIRGRAGRGEGREHIYVIHNGQLLPVAQQIPRSLRGIALRVLESSGRAGIVGDLFRIHGFAREAQANFYWITIPEGVEIEGNEVFDPVVMRRLYDVGNETTRKGPVWVTRPPGFLFDVAP